MIVILHNIRSLYNVGAIFRTADAADIKKIYLGGITPTPLDRFGRVRSQVAKVALGAERTVPWEKVIQLGRLLDQLKRDGYKILAVEQAKSSIPYYRVKLKKTALNKTALVLGNEVRGLPSSILNKADKILEIPMRGKKESLNVATTFAIVVFHLITSSPH